MDYIRLGSPPRVREKPLDLFCNSSSERITPACAGKTPTLELVSFAFRDHPRVCGKNPSLFKCPKYRVGSPPRVREKL